MNSESMLAIRNPILNAAAYKFIKLGDLPPLRETLRELCRQEGLKGSILLTPEGINLFVAGAHRSVGVLLERLRAIPGLENLEAKLSGSEEQPFNRMLVKIKREIITFGIAGINPEIRSSAKITPKALKTWLDEGRDVTLLDTRNDYEIKLGTFSGAKVLGIGHFREFPEAVGRLPDSLKEAPVVMFCTGGIRCEKAGPFMEKEGFRNILQLEGGILKYFEECGGAHFNGECFVFDKRVGLDADLNETGSQLCFACQMPLTPEELKDPRYSYEVSCPSCHGKNVPTGSDPSSGYRMLTG